MSELAAFHTAFAGAAASANQAALVPFLNSPDDLVRVRVYRNNVAAAIAAALASSYPAVRRLVGEAFFNAAGVAYFDAEPPTTRTLVAYGGTFATFLENMAAAQSTPYVADAARLDRAWLEAHLAPDAAALRVEDLARLDGDALAARRVALHPSVRRVQTDWRIYDVWWANRADDAEAEVAREVTRGRQSVLVWRVGNEVEHRLLGAGEAAFLRALAGGAALGAAVEAASDAGSADASAIFAAALSSGVLAQDAETWGGKK